MTLLSPDIETDIAVEPPGEDTSGVFGYIVNNSMEILSFIVLLSVLFVFSVVNFLFFHGLVELFSIVVAGTIFLITWNSRKILDNNYLKFLGLTYIFIGVIDLVHLLAYKGMGVWPEFDANLPTQLWIAARSLQALTLLIAPLMIKRRVYERFTIAAYSSVVILLLLSIFVWQIFPTCFVEGVGLTPYKINSEYLISAILVASSVLLYKEREVFDKHVLRLLLFSVFTTIGSELAFTFYVSVFGFSNVIGHFLKIIAFYLLYKAIIKIGVEQPYNVIFRNQVIMNERLSRALQVVEEQNYQLKSLDKMKSHFMSMATHELRTPLVSIKGYTELMRSGKIEGVPQNIDGMLEIIERNADTLMMLTEDLMDGQRLEEGRLNINLDRVEIQDLISETSDEAQPFLNEKDQTLKMRVPKVMPPISADRVRIAQVVLNLLNNASKFTPNGGTIVLEAKISSGMVEVSVSDNGIGLSQNDIAKLFKPFPDIHHAVKTPSTGLGLSICKGIIDLHEGEIWAESEGEGKGSTFCFRVPIFGGMEA